MKFRIKYTLFLILCNVLSVFVMTAAKGTQSKLSLLDDEDDDNKSPTKSNSSCNTMRFGNIVIPSSYNKLEFPSYNKSRLLEKGFPLSRVDSRIYVAVLIRGIGNVDELEEEITVEMDFKTSWPDLVWFGENYDLLEETLQNAKNGRIVEGFQSLDPEFLNHIWKPDLFIENVVSVHRPAIFVKPIKVLVHPAGWVVFSARLTVTVDCKMEFYYYPADTQKCDLKIRSYSHTIQEIELVWEQPFGVYITDREEHNFDIQVHNVTQYIITEPEVMLSPDHNETYRVLQFSILARRRLSFHMVQTYLPSIFFIVITWLCFLIPVSLVEARIGVAMTTLLTLTSMFSSVRESTPTVSYIKAIDIWMVACIFFVFSTLLEFAICIFMRHDDTDEEEGVNDHELDNITPMPFVIATTRKPSVEQAMDSFFVRLRNIRKRKARLSAIARRERKKFANWIEKYAILIFFTTFLGFNLIYWPWLLIASNYFDWHVDPKYNANAN